MVFRLCLCVVLLCAFGYVTESSDCQIRDNYDTFKKSVDYFLASMDKTCGNTDMRSESKATRLQTMDNRINDLEKKVANLTSELAVDCGSPNSLEGTDVVYSSTGLHSVAKYRCKKGLLNMSPGDQMTSFCLKDGYWTMASMTCVNITSCWMISGSRVVYTGTQSTTRSGKTCQRWDGQEPHSHGYEDGQFIIPGFDSLQTVKESANYCRDPSRSGYLWCYTSNKKARWEKCDVPMCSMLHSPPPSY
ncbi:uncharacterized protein [Haliotis cracherodii]|uniref:uncharacterized protein n=1 Tax=Haliotis cracherodii TaxID=6455 RepID=UPI0039EA501B